MATVVGLAAGAVIALTAWYIVSRGLAPIDDMVETADEIAAGDLTSRVAVLDAVAADSRGESPNVRNRPGAIA